MQRLYELEPGEVSLVPRGAVQRKFLVLKSENGAEMDKKILDLLKQEPESLKKAEEVFKSASVDEQTQTILKAALRLLAPVDPKLVDEVLKAASKKKQDNDGDDDDDDDDVEKAGKKDPKKDCTMKTADKTVEKSEGTMTKEEIAKSMEALPEETRKVLQAVLKTQEDQVKALVEKSESQARELEVVRKMNQKKEMVEKAATFKSLGVATEDLVDTLLVIKSATPEGYEKLEKMLGALNEQVEKGDLFKEQGSSLGGQTKTSWDMIEKAAEAHVAKSGEKVSKAESVTRFLETTEGRTMYKAYMNDHASNKRS